MPSFIENVRSLPVGVLGNVLTFIPRNDTAQLLVDANNNDTLSLLYLRKKNVIDGPYKTELYSTLNPSITCSNVYGDNDSSFLIIRRRISIGDNLRLRHRFRFAILLK